MTFLGFWKLSKGLQQCEEHSLKKNGKISIKQWDLWHFNLPLSHSPALQPQAASKDNSSHSRWKQQPCSHLTEYNRAGALSNHIHKKLSLLDLCIFGRPHLQGSLYLTWLRAFPSEKKPSHRQWHLSKKLQGVAQSHDCPAWGITVQETIY